MDWHIRAADDSDREFLFNTHRLTMRAVIEATWGWDETWQRSDFERRFRDYAMSVVEAAGQPVGALCLEWQPKSLYIWELQILPEFQGKGLGTNILRELIDQGVRRALPVELSTVPANPGAKRLYERLGFRTIGEDAPFIRMTYDSHVPRG